ncbi:MAG: 5'-3' exonuclease [Candidatus Nanopelagicaceae bacterium]|jgi:5'-3' exonuclease|nr:5'-3' exonuclease [Actinomycetota bacterium]NCV83479.1 5'-3' exonuclease [Actinomycetota bacterium]
MTLMLIDSASLWYRAYYGMPDTLLSPKGEPINAVKGFIDMAARLINAYRPDRLAICLDGDWRPSWRVQLFPEYKTNRLDESGEEEEEPDLLTPQVPIILDFFESLGVQIIGADDYEADDVIATLAKRELGPVRVVTGDRDLFQLVDDDRDVKVVYLAKGISAHDLVDSAWIANKYSIPGERYGLFAMIRGDASDGLPGIKGIGEKGAAEIASNFDSIDAVVAAAKSQDKNLRDIHRKRILADEAYAGIVEELVSCAVNISLPKVDFKIPNQAEDAKMLEKLTKEHGLATSFTRLKAALGWE